MKKPRSFIKILFSVSIFILNTNNLIGMEAGEPPTTITQEHLIQMLIKAVPQASENELSKSLAKSKLTESWLAENEAAKQIKLNEIKAAIAEQNREKTKEEARIIKANRFKAAQDLKTAQDKVTREKLAKDIDEQNTALAERLKKQRKSLEESSILIDEKDKNLIKQDEKAIEQVKKSLIETIEKTGKKAALEIPEEILAKEKEIKKEKEKIEIAKKDIEKEKEKIKEEEKVTEEVTAILHNIQEPQIEVTAILHRIPETLQQQKEKDDAETKKIQEENAQIKQIAQQTKEKEEKLITKYKEQLKQASDLEAFNKILNNAFENLDEAPYEKLKKDFEEQRKTLTEKFREKEKVKLPTGITKEINRLLNLAEYELNRNNKTMAQKYLNQAISILQKSKVNIGNLQVSKKAIVDIRNMIKAF